MIARRHLVSTWFAILAILSNALVPTVSLAFESAGGRNSASGDWIELCTSLGASWVQLGPDGQLLAQTPQPPDGAPTAAHQRHCPYCLTHAASFGLPPVPVMVLPLWSAAPDLLPQLVWRTLASRVWLVPAARAPPSI